MAEMGEIFKHPRLDDPEAIARRNEFELVPDPMDVGERARLGLAVAALGIRRVREEAAKIRASLAEQGKLLKAD